MKAAGEATLAALAHLRAREPWVRAGEGVV